MDVPVGSTSIDLRDVEYVSSDRIWTVSDGLGRLDTVQIQEMIGYSVIRRLNSAVNYEAFLFPLLTKAGQWEVEAP